MQPYTFLLEVAELTLYRWVTAAWLRKKLRLETCTWQLYGYELSILGMLVLPCSSSYDHV